MGYRVHHFVVNQLLRIHGNLEFRASFSFLGRYEFVDHHFPHEDRIVRGFTVVEPMLRHTQILKTYPI